MLVFYKPKLCRLNRLLGTGSMWIEPAIRNQKPWIEPAIRNRGGSSRLLGTEILWIEPVIRNLGFRLLGTGIPF